MPFTIRQRIGLALGPVLFLALGLTAGGLGGPARWTAAAVAWMVIWWITEPVPLWLTACIPLVVFPLCGTAALPAVLLQYVDPINFLFLGGMMIAASMQQWGLHRRIALAIVARVGSSPARIVLGFMLATGFISLWISNTAATMMMFPIAMAVLLNFEETLGRNDPGLRRFGLALMLGVAYAASIGGMGTKIGTAPNLVFVKQAEMHLGHDVDFVTWLKVGLPVVLVALPLVWLYLVRWAVPVQQTELVGYATAVIAKGRMRLGPMKAGEYAALIGFLLAALLWILRKDIDLGSITIPGWWGRVPFGWEDWIGRPIDTLPAPLARLLRQDAGDAAVAMGIGVMLFLIPVSVRPFRCALAPRQMQTLPWGLLVLLGGGFAMAYGMQESGLSAWFAGLLKGADPASPLVVFILVCLFTTALTEVASNTATANVLLPILAASAPSFGLHPAPLMFAATLAASLGFMLPAGTPPNAIVYSSGYITVAQMARSGILIDLTGALFIGVLCYFLAPWALGVTRLSP
ncbi:MAG: SLC13 family permease [Gammaproteobacteria bacterium]